MLSNGRQGRMPGGANADIVPTVNEARKVKRTTPFRLAVNAIKFSINITNMQITKFKIEHWVHGTWVPSCESAYSA